MVNGRDQKLNRLTDLCRELVGRGVRVGLSDARPALSVRGDLVEPKVWVEVDTEDGCFVWRRDDLARHPVDDPAGAAEELARYLRNREGGSGRRP